MKTRSLLLLCLCMALCVVAAAWAASTASAAQPPVKQLGGSPTDIVSGAMRLPEPEAAAIRSHSATLPVNFSQEKDGHWRWRSELLVDSASPLTLLALNPEGSSWSLRLSGPEGAQIALAEGRAVAGVDQAVSTFGLGDNGYPARMYTIAAPQPGRWTLEVTATGKESAGVVIVAAKESAYRLRTNLTGYDLLVGREIGLVAAVEAGDKVAAESVVEAEISVRRPNGETLRLAMADDGLHGDGAANDGLFGARFTAIEAGEHIAQVVVQGKGEDGEPFLRTTEHLFPVIAPSVALSGERATATVIDSVRMGLGIPATSLSAATNEVKVYAEVWGTGVDGKSTPVGWVSTITAPQTTANGLSLPLSLDSRWIALANARAPFELRAIRVQDLQTHIPVATLERLDLQVDALPRAARMKVTGVTEEMVMGPRPAALAQATAGKLLLVHGYCSGPNPWPASNFTNYAVFNDPNQNRTHDVFARMIRDFGAPYGSFGVVAHSQGGAASLHLYTYYWSGLDNAVGSRLIQSVGTPYQGTNLAGNLALLGSIFGVGCGTNWDLTYDGASLWLSGIPTWARAKVHYATTSFTDLWWRYDYCNAASDTVLSDPEDGTTEQARGQLSGANNMGHKTGWCHTSGMRDPAQTSDGTRNANMNSNAAR